MDASAADQVNDERLDSIHKEQWFNRVAQAIMHKTSLSAVFGVHADLN